MKHNTCYALSLFLVSIFIPAFGYADQKNQLIIVNNYGKQLEFLISVNPDVIPDFPQTFVLDDHDTAVSTVLDMEKEAYILTEDEEKHLGFWGVEIKNNKTLIHGYTSKGIAFSYHDQTIIFCKSEDYMKNGLCPEDA